MTTLITKPRFATGGSADVSEPTEAQKDTGWVDKQKPPHERFNWLHKQTYEAVDNLLDAHARYSSLEQFIAEAEPGDTGRILGYFSDVLPCDEIDADAPAGAFDAEFIHGDGSELFIGFNTAVPSVLVFEPDLSFKFTWTLSAAPTTLVGVQTNSEYVVVAYDQVIEIRDRATASLVTGSSISHGAALADIAIDHANVYVVGASGTGTKTVRAYRLSDGVELWNYDHGALTNAVCTEGGRVYIGGNPGTGGHHVRALNRTTGAVIWEFTDTTVAGAQTMASDGIDLFVKANTKLLRVDPRSGGTLEEAAVSASDTSVIWLTPRYLFLRLGDGVVYIDRFGNIPAFGGTPNNFPVIVSHGDVPNTLYSDGDRFYMGGVLTGGVTVRKHYMPRLVDRMWRRVQTSDAYQPLRGLAHPID